MTAFVFIIDNKREDGYYHYRRYPSGTELDENGNLKDTSIYYLGAAWSLCSKQDNDNRQPWIDAVNFYLKRTNTITLKDTILGYIENIKRLVLADEKSFPDNKSLVMPQISSIMELINDTNPKECDDEFITNLHSLGTMELPTIKSQFKYAWLSTKFNVNNEIDKAIYSLTSNISSGYLIPLLDIAEKLVNDFFSKVDSVYIEVKRICNKCVRIWNTCKSITDEETRKKLLSKFVDECIVVSKKYGNWILDYLYTILCIDSLVKVFKALTQLSRYGKNAWKHMLQELRLLCDTFLENDFFKLVSKSILKLKESIYSIIGLLSTLMGALFAAVCADEEIKVKDQSRICGDKASNILELCNKITNSNNNSSQNDVNNYDSSQNNSVINDITGNYNNSVVLRYTKNNDKNFSLTNNTKLTSSNNTDTNLSNSTNTQIADHNILCKVSLCDNYEPDDSNIINTNIESFMEPSKICIEIDKNLSYTLNVTKNQHVKMNDNICTINDISLKSINEFIVEDVQKNYIIGTYYVDSSLNDLQNDNIETLAGQYFNNQLSSFNDEDIQNISKRMTKQYNIENFLINYLSYFRYPDFATHTREHAKGDVAKVSTQEFVEVYENKIKTLYEKFVDDMKHIAGKDNIHSKASQGKIVSLQDEISSCKNEYINNVIKLYNENPGNLKYCSIGRISDFSLHDLYVNYINEFNYDETNEYVVKLFDLVNSFIAKRKRIEINVSNINSLITTFNEVCEKYIKKYWQKPLDDDYYTEFSNLFESDINLITNSNISDINSSNLYKNVLNYLQSLTKCTALKEYQLSVDDIGDYNKFLENQSKSSTNSSYDETQMELLKHLKNIALRFASIKDIEITNASLNTRGDIKDGLNYDEASLSTIAFKDYDDYYDGKIYSTQENANFLAQKKILAGYLKTLKEVTDNESKQISEFLKSIIAEYLEMDFSIDSYISEFNNILGTSWPNPSMIYHNNTKCNFYFFGKNNVSLSSTKELKELENDIVVDIKKPLPDNIEYDPSFYYGKKSNDNINIDTDELNSASPGITSLKYWLRYCSMATMYHAALPMFWSTGIVINGSPISLPVIYIPIKVFSGKRVTTVCGIGLCGICPLPMLLFLNLSAVKMTLLPMMNIMIDALFESLKQLTNVPLQQIKSTTKSLVDALDTQIENCRNSRKDIDFQISELKRLPRSGTLIQELGLSMNNDVLYKKGFSDNELIYPSIAYYNMSNYNLPEGGDPFDVSIYASANADYDKELSEMKYYAYTAKYLENMRKQSLEALDRMEKERNNQTGEIDDSYSGKENETGGISAAAVTVTVSRNYTHAYSVWREWCRSWEGIGYSKNDIAGYTYRGVVYNGGLYDSYLKHTKKTKPTNYKEFERQVDAGLWDDIAYTMVWKLTNIVKINNIWISIMVAMSYWHLPGFSLIKNLNKKYAKEEKDTKISDYLAIDTINEINKLSDDSSEALFNSLHNYWNDVYNNKYYSKAGGQGKLTLPFTTTQRGLLNRLNSVHYGYVTLNDSNHKAIK